MSGDSEIDNCSFCGTLTTVLREYLYSTKTRGFCYVKYCDECGKPELARHVPNDGDKVSPKEHIEQAKKFLGEKL